MATELHQGYAVEENASDQVDKCFEMGSYPQMGGTVTDENDMRILGRVQQLSVSTQLVSIKYVLQICSTDAV